MSQEADQEPRTWPRGVTSALAGGGFAAVVLAGTIISVGSVGAHEAGVLLESIQTTARFLAAGVLTASATTLALMLTLLGLSDDVSERLNDMHYIRIKYIALIDTAAFIGATGLMAILVVPFSEATEIEGGWYVIVYYLVVAASAILSGLMVTVVLMICKTIFDMTTLFISGADSLLVSDEGEP